MTLSLRRLLIKWLVPIAIPDVSFTEMSAKILEPEFEPMYGNVYQKGALIGMCLDLYILKYSNSEKDLQWVMRQLAKKYGKEKSFKDEDLFDVITALTSPEVGAFLDKHVAGPNRSPTQKYYHGRVLNTTSRPLRK